MSDLHKRLFKKTGKPPMDMKPPKNEEMEDDEQDEKEEMKDQFPTDLKSNFLTKAPLIVNHNINMDIKPVTTTTMQSDQNKFVLPPTKKKVGAEWTPLKWEDYFDKLEYLNDGTSIFIAGNLNPVFVCLHGAGHSALSFACLAAEVKKFATVVAFDFRGHGYSKVGEGKDDLKIDTLINDTIKILSWVDKKYPESSIIIMGHSMGGAVATKACDEAMKLEMASKIQGLIVIDVVEGTAIEALPFMEHIVKSRPNSFKSLEQAIQWSIRSGTLKNAISARVSIPTQLVEKKNELTGNIEYTWRNDLMASQEFWMGWFKGLTQAFLDIKMPKLLLLAGAERMDKELTIAQMQGKFRLKVIYGTGHSIQEDNYVETAKSCYQFLENFKIPLNLYEMELIAKHGIGKFHAALPKNPFQQCICYSLMQQLNLLIT